MRPTALTEPPPSSPHVAARQRPAAGGQWAALPLSGAAQPGGLWSTAAVLLPSRDEALLLCGSTHDGNSLNDNSNGAFALCGESSLWRGGMPGAGRRPAAAAQRCLRRRFAGRSLRAALGRCRRCPQLLRCVCVRSGVAGAAYEVQINVYCNKCPSKYLRRAELRSARRPSCSPPSCSSRLAYYFRSLIMWIMTLSGRKRCSCCGYVPFTAVLGGV